MATSLSNLTAGQLRWAASLREKIDSLQRQLNAVLAAAPAVKPAPAARAAKATTPAKPAKAKRKLSKAGRAKLSASAKARWAKAKAAGKTRL
jgi:hypothetical protein